MNMGNVHDKKLPDFCWQHSGINFEIAFIEACASTILFLPFPEQLFSQAFGAVPISTPK